MKDRDIEYLKKYQKEVGYGCLYVDDISVAANVVILRSVRFANSEDSLFNEGDYSKVVDFTKRAIKEVKKKHLKPKCNKISHLIFYDGKVTGGFGLFIVRTTCPEIESVMKSKSKGAGYAMGLLMMRYN